MERLKAFSVEKFTLDGRKFHTLTISTSSTVNTTWFVQFVRMAPSSSYRAEFKKNLKKITVSLLHQRRSYNRISDLNANVVILDSTSQDSAVSHCMTCVWVLAVFYTN